MNLSHVQFDTVIHMAKSSAIRNIGAVWGVGGVVALLGFAVWRLTPHALEIANSAIFVADY